MPPQRNPLRPKSRGRRCRGLWIARRRGPSGWRCTGRQGERKRELVEGRRAEHDAPQRGINPDRQQPQAWRPQHPIHPRRQGGHRQYQRLHSLQGKSGRSGRSGRVAQQQIGKPSALRVQISATVAASCQSKGARRQGATHQGQPLRQLRRDHRGGGAGVEQQADAGALNVLAIAAGLAGSRAGSGSGCAGAGRRPDAQNLKVEHRRVASLGPLQRHAHRAPAAAARKRLAGQLDQGMGRSAGGGTDR